MGFYGSNDPTNSVKTLKEEVILRIGFNPTRCTRSLTVYHLFPSVLYHSHLGNSKKPTAIIRKVSLWAQPWVNYSNLEQP